MEQIKNAIQNGKTVLGIELGSTRIKAVLIDENNNPIKMIETGTDGLGDLTCTIFKNEWYNTKRDVSTVEVGDIIFWTTTASDGRTWNHKGTVFATAEGHPNRS